MKKLLLLIAVLISYLSGYAQKNYLLPNSLAGVSTYTQGTEYLSQDYRDTSTATTAQELWYVSPKGWNGTAFVQAGKLQVIVRNLTSSWKKVSLYDFTSTNLIRTQNIGPNAEIIFGRYQGAATDLPLDASKDYYWKFEALPVQTPIVNWDSYNIAQSTTDYINVKANDTNLPASCDVRIKPGQTISGMTVERQSDNTFKIVSGTTAGNYTFWYQLINPTTSEVLGEGKVTITVLTANGYCDFSILTESLKTGYTHEFTLYSANFTNLSPYDYKVINASGNAVLSGTTPTSSSWKETIDFASLASGTYTVEFSSTTRTCKAQISVSHVAESLVCTASISSVNKVANTNSYNVVSNFTGTTAIDYYITSGSTSNSTILLQSTGISTQNFTIDANSLASGSYNIAITGRDGKVCSANKTFEHTLLSAAVGNKLETWTKVFHNYKDNWIISGKQDQESGRDKFGMWYTAENRSSMEWKAFISDFENEGGSELAKAIIGLRKDTARNEPSVSIAVMPTKVSLQTRATKSGATQIVSSALGIKAPVWVKLVKNGDNIGAYYSKDMTMNPSWTSIGSVSGGASGYSKYVKFLGVTSAKADVIASARFQGHLGGLVNFDQPSTTVPPAVIATNVTAPTAGQSVTISTTTFCIADAINRWYKNTATTSFASGSSVTVQAANADSYYSRCETATVKSAISNKVTFTLSTPQSYCGLTDKLKLGTKIVGTTSYDMYARIFDGKLWLTQSLNTTPESFLVRAVNFISITFTKTWSGTDYSCFEGQTSGFGGVVEPTGFTTPTGYTLTQTADGAKIYTLGSSGGAGGGGDEPTEPIATVFQNKTKLVPIELTNGKYSPQSFPKISTVISTDAVIGKAFPNWAVAWQVEGGNFKAANLKPQDLGISFNYDHNPQFYNGIGERCIDYIYETNPNTGQPWVDDIDESCSPKKWTTFISSIPFYERGFSGFGAAGEGDRNRWIANSKEWAFDQGAEAVQARRLGHGDKANGKVNVGLVNADIEIGLEMGQDYLPKHLAFLLGGGSATQGYFFSQYSAPINQVGAELSTYPDANGVYPTIRQKIDGSTIYEGNGTPSVNNIPTSWDWNPLNKIDLSGRVTNKGVIDYPNILPCVEISSTSEMTFRHGQTYARKGGWKYELETWQTSEVSPNPVPNTNPQLYYHSGMILSYSPSNPIDNTVVDKFGLDRNTHHIIADVINYGDVNKLYSIAKLNNRKVFLQSKITCDRSHEGVFWDAGFTNQALRFLHYDREYSFDIGGFTALTGCEWQIWDRNYDKNLDGYHGAFGLVNLMHQRVNGKSFVDLKPTLTFLLHNSEVSYNGGTSYVKNKATDYILSENNLPQRQAISTDGYWVIFAARPEGIEPTSAKFRIQYNGTWYYHTITASDWETVDYTYKDVANANLPLASKDYYFTIIKLGSSSSTPVGGGTSVTAPTIISNPVSPIAGNNVTFTATGCSAGTVKWYNSTTQAGTGTTYSITTAVAGNSFTATCTEGSVVSSASNSITIATNEVPVFVFWGESNAGSRNLFSTASTGDLGVRTGVRILNNSNNTLETLNIATTSNGGNSSYGENDCTPNENWGWEVPAANYFASGALQKPELIIVKVAQGGSFIGQWNDDISGGYFQIAQARINAVKAQLANEGKVPKWYINYSQGINNGTPSGQTLTDPGHFPGQTGIGYWGSATSVLLPKILTMTSSNANIVMTKFGPTQYGSYLNSKIDEICNNSGGKYRAISPDGLSVQGDQLHWDAPSTKTAFGRMLTAHGL